MAQKYSTWIFNMPGTGEDILGNQEEVLRQAEEYINRYEQKNKTTIGNKLKAISEMTDPDARVKALRTLARDTNGELLDFIKKNTQMTTRDCYKPGNFLLTNASVRVESLQGVGTAVINPWRMNAVSGKISSVPVFLAQMMGIIAGSGEKENIGFALQQLREAAGQNALPDRIVLNGHSRGAAASIELARAIYEEFGDKVKIAMNINDPVPGPGRHAKSKMVIPPNVDSLVITYAAQETRRIMAPLDLREIYFDPKRTTVTTIPLPVTHLFDSDDADTPKMCVEAISQINSDMMKTIISGRGHKFASPLPMKFDSNAKGSGAREKCEFVIATDATLNTTLPAALKDFHQALRLSAYLSGPAHEPPPKGEHREYVSQMTSGIDESTREGRKMMLDVIYSSGEKAATHIAQVSSGNNSQYEVLSKGFKSADKRVDYSDTRMSLPNTLGNKLQTFFSPGKNKRSAITLKATNQVMDAPKKQTNVAHFNHASHVTEYEQNIPDIQILQELPTFSAIEPSTAGSLVASTSPAINTTDTINNKVRVHQTTINTKAFLGQKSSTDVASIQRMRGGTFVSNLYVKDPKAIKKFNADNYLQWAVIEVENFRAANPNPNEPMIIKGNMPPKLVKEIAIYCTAKNYDYKLTVAKLTDFKPSPTDIAALEKRLEKNRTIIYGHAEILATQRKEVEKIEGEIRHVPPSLGGGSKN